MNYKAELRGFALDRAIRIKELHQGDEKTDSFDLADKIVDYLYIPEKDIESHLKTVLPLFVQARNPELLDEAILHLEQIKAEMEAELKREREIAEAEKAMEAA